ncbi:Galactinol-sucrose galactosyltransferase [Penicillium ucsense]|uniref:Galactinol-sucrose galactosyltransferase n=1 Tax=Penicillium ucsense TaxID=2839758 RepID=A0A8J8W1H8_9EURO|nr:Galactinol-sucrose galactosyltransferase [Penicillium ucsense]KAF7735722.1 Galactinol-sucrose galactosyltransferase [Penicillium ucsense]
MPAGTQNVSSTLPIIGPGKNQKTRQATFIRSAQMGLFARLTCYPPLSQVTNWRRRQAGDSGAHDSVNFTVVIESSTSLPTQAWEAQIWHNITDNEWSALPLQASKSSVAPLLNGVEDEYKYHRYVFCGEICLPPTALHAQFTARFRTSPDVEWLWVNQQQQNVTDGELVVAAKPMQSQYSAQESEVARDELSKLIDNLSSELKVESRKSEALGSTLWQIRGEVDPAKDGLSGIKRTVLGTPSSMVRYYSLVRIWSPWLGPRHGKDHFHLTEDAILCSFLRQDGKHLVLLAISGIDDVLTVFQSSDNGEIVVQARNDNVEAAEYQIVAATAEDFEVAMCAVMYESRKIVRPFQSSENDSIERLSSPPLDEDAIVVEKDIQTKWLADWIDGLTYCTWNGLGQNLNEEKILHALDSLKANDIHVVNLIIDDNWQSLDNEGKSQFKRRWKQFEANPEAFPRGLQRTVETIRQAHRNVGHIAVWHALLGYWGGICPDGELAQKYKTKEVKVKDPAAGGPIAHEIGDGTILTIHPDDVQRFYDDFYGSLRSWGVDSVKADAQFFLDLLDSADDRKNYMTSYQDAWSLATLRHFSNRAISCMSLIPQMIFHSQLPTNKPSITLRNSDDFFPEIPSSHPWHVFCNAHNAHLTRHLNALPDWDMFQTSHPYAAFHAAARCVSGGPIYITDEPGKHDVDLINQMTALTVQGTTVILRPSVIGRSLDIYHDYNEGHVLRVGSYTGWARTGSGIIGLFNVQSADASCIIPLMDFPGINETSRGEYVVRAHTSGKITGRLKPLANDALASVVLEPKGWEILTAHPTTPLTLKGSRGEGDSEPLTHIAVLGLVGKMTGAAAVVSSDTSIMDNGRLRCDVHLKALGTLGIYISDLADRVIADDFMITILGQPIPKAAVWKEGGEKSNVLAIDVLAAWKEMKLDSGWSNEAFVRIFMT